MKIAFTGHRDIKDLSSLKKAIESLSFSDSDEFLVGGSTGFDFLILNELLKRKLHSQITLCVPFRGFEKYLEKDSSILNSMLKIHYSSGLKIVEFNNKGNSFSEKTKARNQYMVDNAEIF